MWLNYCHCSLHFVFINLHFFKQNGISSSLCSNRALHYVCKTNLSYKKVSQTFQWSVYSVMWYSMEYTFPIYLNSVGLFINKLKTLPSLVFSRIRDHGNELPVFPNSFVHLTSFSMIPWFALKDWRERIAF